MLEINIISPQLKKELKQKLIYANVKNLVFLLFFFSVVYITLILIMKLILQIHFIDTVSQTNILTKNIGNYGLQVTKINEDIIDAKTIQADYRKMSSLLIFIQKIKPQGIALQQINAATSEKLYLKGFADTREGLLEFKAALENSGKFSAFELPIQNLLKEKNIDFEINLTITNHVFD